MGQGGSRTTTTSAIATSASRREAQRMKSGELAAAQQSNLGLSSNFVIAQNVIGALLAVPVLVTGVIVSQQKSATNTNTSILRGDECASFMEKPVIAVGILLLVVSLFGVAMALLAKLNGPPLSRLASWLQLLILFCLVILLFCFSIFALEITNNGLAHTVHGYGQTYNEYRLNEYPKWMRRRVDNPNYWNKAKNCLPRVCKAGIVPEFMSNGTPVVLKSLTPIEGGCCLAPADCNITYIGVPSQNQRNMSRPTLHYALEKSTTMDTIMYNATINNTIRTNDTKMNVNSIMMDKPQLKNSTQCNNDNQTLCNDRRTIINSTITPIEHKINQEMANEIIHLYTHDCNKWSNLPNKLCFDCDTCKAGIIQASMDRWKTAGYVYVSLVMVMIVQYALFACYGFKE